MSSGRDNSSKPKATKSIPTSSIKTIWALFFWQKMAMSPVLNGPNILKPNTSLFVIFTRQENLIFNIVLPNKCGQTFLPNLYKEPNFASCMLSWWIARLITQKITIMTFFLHQLLHCPKPKFLLPLQNIVRPSSLWTNLLTFRWRSDLFDPLFHRGGVLKQSLMVPVYLAIAVRASMQGRMWRGKIHSFHVNSRFLPPLRARQSRELRLIN